MKNVTIVLEEEVLKWARIRAAENDTSVSRMVGEILAEKMERQTVYMRSMEQFLSSTPGILRDKGEKLPTKEEIHER